MSSVENVFSLATKYHGLQFEKLAVCVACDLRDEAGGITVGEEKLEVLTTFMRVSLEDSKQCDASSNDALRDAVAKIWHPLLEKFTRNILELSDNSCIVDFLALSCVYCYENLGGRPLIDEFDSLISNILDSDNGIVGLQNTLLVIERVLEFQTNSLNTAKVQNAIILYLRKLISSFPDAVMKSSIYLRIVGVFLKSSLLLHLDQEVFQTIWKELEGSALSVSEKILQSNQGKCDQQLHHCLMIFDILMEISVSKKESNHCHDLIVRKASRFLSNSSPWLIIQHGLQCSAAPVRKQALFNLRQALVVARDYHLKISASSGVDFTSTPIFLWSDDAREVAMSFWQTFLLLMETLEENQLHVIAPVLTKFDSMVAMTKSTPTIHTSWICVLLHRMMRHESKAVSREGVIMCLKLNPDCCPFLIQSSGTDLLSGKNEVGLFQVLQDVNLYCDFKDSSIAYSEENLPVIATLIEDFLGNCYATHPVPTEFLKFLLSSLNSLTWSAIPLYYFCHGLLTISDHECWNGEDLKELRSAIMKCQRTHDIRLRHAILELLLRCLMKFTKCSECTTEDVLTIILCTVDVKRFLPMFRKFFQTIFYWLCNQFQNFQDIIHQKWQDVVQYICQKISLYCNQQSSESLDECWKISKMYAIVVLVAERSLEQDADCEDMLKQIVMTLNEVVEKGCTHVYMPREKVLRAIIMLNCLVSSWNQHIHRCGTASACNAVSKSLRTLQSYTSMMFSLRSDCLEDIQLCLDTWSHISMFLLKAKPADSFPKLVLQGYVPLLSVVKNSISKTFSIGEIKSVAELKTFTASYMVLNSLGLLALEFGLEQMLDQQLMLLIQDVVGRFDLCGVNISDELRCDVTARDLVVQYSLHQWSSLAFVLSLPEEIHGLNCVTSLKAFINCLDRSSESDIHRYVDALGAIMTNMQGELDENEDLICECLDLSWKTVETMTHSSSFWPVYESFVSAAFQTTLLHLPLPSKIQSKLCDLLESIVEFASSRPSVMQTVCEACINAWNRFNCPNVTSNMKSVNRKSTAISIFHAAPKTELLHIYSNFILQCMIFNHIPKKDDLALQHLLKLRELESKEILDYTKSLSYHVVPISTVSMLLQLDPKSPKDSGFVVSIFKQLLNLDMEITMKKSRYHHGSFVHLTKNSIHQAILVLLPFVTIDADVHLLVEHLIVQLKNDAQPSVRYLMEWALALTIIRFPKFEDTLLDELTCGASDCVSGGGAKFSAICSYLTIALFVGLSKDTNSQECYLLRLVDVCWPWCMSQHFSVRLYALAVLLRIQIHFKETGKSDILMQKQPSLNSCLNFADCATGNVGKNWEKMKDNFFLFEFHPIDDYSLETVYINLPRLCNLQSFPNKNDFPDVPITSNQHPRYISGLLLLNPDEKLGKRGPSKWIPQEAKSNSEHTVAQTERYRKNYGAEDPTDASLDVYSMTDNVQKKIMPWLDNAESTSKDSQIQRPPGLILVASLISKPSNLGGLTRTCEIFGAEGMVIQSHACTSDKVYQSLSVTAHQWLPLKEVKPRNLEDYLSSKRDEGYALIGVEQTAQSVCLSKYRFPAKCVLVLGNEKTGIPISLLKVLDVCVQIPQKGVVRSLNVHVSGAIAIWEYTRQHLTS